MTSSRTKRFTLLFLAVVGLLASACGSSTVFASSWRSPKAEPLAMKGEKVAAVVMARNEGTRKNAEDVLAREITYYGAIGIPMYTLMDAPAAQNEAAAKAAIEKAGVKGVVVMRPLGTRTKTETHTSYYSDPMYGSYWGGYYGYGWGTPWVYPGSTRGALVAGPPIVYGGSTGPSQETTTSTTQVIQVEVMVYSLKQNLLVFAGVSETTEADKIDEFVTQLAAATVKELGAQRLIPSKD
jgi:hypothetical protein